MFRKLTNGCVKLVQKYLPDAFLFAVILTVIVFLLGIFCTGQTPMAMVLHWGNGFWALLAFSMQMALILVTGHTLASTPVIDKFLDKMASKPKTPGGAILLVTFISGIAMFVNWGFGLIIGPLFAKKLARRVKGVDYRLLIASAYSTIAVWHAGISGSIPLKLAGAANLAKQTAGAVTEAVPTTQTIFSPWNLVISVVVIVVLPFVNKAMHPKGDNVVTIDPKLLEAEEQQAATLDRSQMTPADKLENSVIISMIVGAMGLVYIVYHFATKGFDLNLNIVNFIFLFLGIILHGTPRRFLDAIKQAAQGVGGIILQFPFYAGIMGMMVGANAAGFSLAGLMSNGFVAISTPKTFPLFTYLSAGIVNFFVPSGGGQWAVQAPIMMPAGAQLGVPAAKTGMAIAWGDAWTNLIQPFWALPALGLAKLGAKDIMGFCLVDLIVVGIITCVGFLILL